ncbi:MAG: hypothetical protein K0R10_1605 [Alphaproteobacteria bacterium]|jgi:hypothetical protein|nr:hypothetical protein [Alphaproteobacteria bacterium]
MSINTTNPKVAAFQAQYKYKVGGSFDITLSKIGGAIPDAMQYGFLKSARVKEVGLLNALKSSALSDGEKSKASAEAKLAFTRDAYRLYKNERNSDDTKMTAKQSVRALSYSLKELASATADYVKAYNSGVEMTTTEKAKFISDTRLILNNAKTFTVVLKPELRKEGEYFSLDLLKAKQYAEQITAHIAALQAPPVPNATAPAADPEDTTGDPADVVPVSDEGQTLDIEA